jgi:hypothetical protein
VQRRAQEEDRTTEGSVKLCQEGIERVHRVHQGILFRFLREEKCLGEDTHIVVEYSVGSQGVLEQKFPGGNLHLFEGQKRQRPLRSEQLRLKERKDLCKECTRPTLR